MDLSFVTAHKALVGFVRFCGAKALCVIVVFLFVSKAGADEFIKFGKASDGLVVIGSGYVGGNTAGQLKLAGASGGKYPESSTLTNNERNRFKENPYSERPYRDVKHDGLAVNTAFRGSRSGDSAGLSGGISADAPGSPVQRKYAPTESELRQLFLQTVKAAAEYSPSIQRAAAEAEAAQSDIDEASGQRFPQIDIGTRSKSASFGSGYKNENNDQAVTLDVVTPVYDWGRISKTIESRTFLSTAASALLEAELENSAFDVTSNLIELSKQHIVVDISQAFMERMSGLVNMLEGIVAVDTGRVSELTQAKAKLLQAQTLRSSAQSRVRDIEISLHKMLGNYPIPALPHSNYWNIYTPDQEKIVAAAIDHPVIKKSEAEARSAELQADVVKSSSLPQLNWVVSKSTGEDSYGREQAWQTSLSITWAAFRGGSQRAAERAARQRAEASRQATDTQVQDIEYRVQAASHDARMMFERSEQYRELTLESDKIRKAFYEQWYHLGKRSLLDVLISENDHYNNQVNEVSNRFDAYNAIMRQYAASGLLTRWLRTGQ